VVADFDRAIARVPKLIALLGLIGGGTYWARNGLTDGSSFLAGAVAAWLNFKLLERFVNRLGELALAQPGKAVKASGFRAFIPFAMVVAAVFVIIRLTGFNAAVALWGFLVCPAAVMLEILYELITYGHS
jgi:hypothetical protein